jgi:hypothetical protein
VIIKSVLQKRIAHTKCDFWVWEVFPTSRCRNWRRSDSGHACQFAKPVCAGPACQVPNHTGLHCLPSTETMAKQDVDAKNRHRKWHDPKIMPFLNTIKLSYALRPFGRRSFFVFKGGRTGPSVNILWNNCQLSSRKALREKPWSKKWYNHILR